MPDSATAQLPPDQGLYPTLISGKGPLYQTPSLPLDGAAINLANIQLDKSSSNHGPIATPTPSKTNDNNPGNIKTFGPNGQLIYASYDNPQAGVQAIGDWAVKAQQTHGLTTVRQLIDDPQHGYAPQADPGNRGKPLVEEAAARMGVSPDEPIDLTNPAVRQKWTDAILAQEGHGDKESAGSLQSFQQSQAATSNLIAQRQAQLDKVLASLSTGKGDTQERRKMLQDALDHSRELQDQMLNMSRNPPTQKPTDLMSTFGSLAMLIGAIGGLKSRQPATAALQAAAGVIEGVNTNNHEEFERNFKTWQTQSKLLEDLTGIQAQDFRTILENDRLDEAERHNQMEETMQKWEMGDSLFKLQAGQIEEAYKAPFEIMRLHSEIGLKNAQAEEALQRGQWYAQGQPGRRAASEISVTDKDGKTEKYVAHEVGPGQWMDDATGRMIDTSNAKIDILKTGQGRQAAMQNTSITIAGNSASAALSNLMDLPISASLGVTMGVQFKSPDDMAEAVKRSLARTLTPKEQDAIFVSFQGVGRDLAVLENSGRATGLVGLAKQAEGLAPQSGQTGYETLRRYAEIRQIVERTLEVVINHNDTDDKQKVLLGKILDEVKQSVPFTVKDINAIEFKPTVEKVSDFAKKVQAAGAAERIENKSTYKSPDDIYNALDRGDITKDQAKEALIKQFGYTPNQ